MYRRRFVRLAGAGIAVVGLGNTAVMGDGGIDPAATPPNSRRASRRGNSLRSKAEQVPLEPGDIEEVTTTNDDGDEVTYWVVRHGVEYDEAIYRETARLGGSNFELPGSDTGSFWFGIAGPDLERIAHQGQVTLYFRVSGEDDDADEDSSVGAAGNGNGNGNGRNGNGNNGNGNGNGGNGDDDDTDEGDEEDADGGAKWVSLKAQFTAGWKDELIHVNGVTPDGEEEEDDEDEEDEAGDGDDAGDGDEEEEDNADDGDDQENGDEDDDDDEGDEEDADDEEEESSSDEGEDDEDGDADEADGKQADELNDDDDGGPEGEGPPDSAGDPGRGNRPPENGDSLPPGIARRRR